jgi:glycosyltransferase involved in cell wall biosynthesis
MKVAFVVQRYGLEVNGGAELLCRMVAEHLSGDYDIEILTTCAIDYMTWKNEYNEGIEIVNGIKVRRFPVDVPRNVERFNKQSEKIFFNRPHTREQELEWMRLQGPYSEKLLSYIKDNANVYDRFIFFTYLYCTTFFGLPLVKDKAILVPTAHDEPPIYLKIFYEIFHAPKAIMYNTEEEKAFVDKTFNVQGIVSDVAGAGIDLPQGYNPDSFKQKYRLDDDFIIYVGRIDESKGCKQLFDYFSRYKSHERSTIKLVLIGKPVMRVPDSKDIISLGFVPEEDKFNGMMASKLLVLPSKYESLSLVTLEAWACGRPVLVNGECEVLKAHCIRSNAGLWYENYDEFKECMNLLLSSDSLRQRFGLNGQKYIALNYSWQNVIKKYRTMLDT